MLSIDANFPGGNIHVHESHGDTFFLSPDKRGSSLPAPYWAFRVRNAEGRRLVFKFLSSSPVHSSGPAVSEDGGNSWRWGAEGFDGNSFVATVPHDSGEIYFASAPLYTEENWKKFLASFDAGQFALEPLASSRKGRNAELLTLGKAKDKALCHILVTARHNAMATAASYALEGIIRAFLSSGEKEAEWARNNICALIVPFADKDGVEEGDPGIGRIPRSHGYDYGHFTHIYPETEAVSRLVKDVIKKNGKLDFLVDIDSSIPDPDAKDASAEKRTGSLPASGKRFLNHLKSLAGDSGAFSLEHSSKIAMPVDAGQDFAKGLSLAGWAGKLLGVKFAAGIKIPSTASPESARDFGDATAKAIVRFLKGARRIRQ